MKYLNETQYLWSLTIVSLVLNVLVTIGSFFIRNELAKKLIFPFICSFLLFYGNHDELNEIYTRLLNTSNMIVCLTIVVFAILDFIIPNKKKQVENSSDQEDNGSEKNDQQSIKISLILWVLMLWLFDIINGIQEFNSFKDSGNTKPITDFFNLIFGFLTKQFVCSMYLLYNNQPTWLYFVCMVPKAVLFSLSAIIAYYHRSEKVDDIEICHICASAFCYGSFTYLAFISIFDLITQFKKGSNVQLKHLLCLMFLGGLLWEKFIRGISTM